MKIYLPNQFYMQTLNENEKDINKDNFSNLLIFEDYISQNKNIFLTHSELNNLLKQFQTIEAAGGIVLNTNNETLFIFRRGKWDLPKGKVEVNEKLESAALREVAEETNIHQIKIKQKITITYHIYKGFKQEWILKKTHWFLMKNLIQEIPIPQKEEDISEVKWINNKNIKIVLDNTFPLINDLITNLYKI